MERRHFLKAVGIAGAGAAWTPTWAQRPRLYDILIKGGEVIDPSRAFRGIADVAVLDGKVRRSRVASRLSAESTSSTPKGSLSLRVWWTCTRTFTTDYSSVSRRTQSRRDREPRRGWMRAHSRRTKFPDSAGSLLNRRARASMVSCISTRVIGIPMTTPLNTSTA
jgi:hypothetical protein